MNRQTHLLVLGLLALAPACKRLEGAEPKAQRQAQPQRPPAPVSLATAVERDVPVYLDQIGKNVAPEVVTMLVAALAPVFVGPRERFVVEDPPETRPAPPVVEVAPVRIYRLRRSRGSF